MYKQIQETAAYLRARLPYVPKAAIVLGSGLGGLAAAIEDRSEIPYSEIPGFLPSTVEGHSGKLLCGRLGETPVLAMQGRYHYYEGYSTAQATFPIRVFKELGIETLLLSNAAGGMNPSLEIGDLMIISDHIYLIPDHPLRGANDNRLGPRFPDMGNAYDADLRAKAREIAAELGIKVSEGVYVATQGPTYETPAEYRYFHRIGGDAVGMSTAPEVIVARHAGIKVFAMSIITDVWREGQVAKISHEEVQTQADAAQPRMTSIFSGLLKKGLGVRG